MTERPDLENASFSSRYDDSAGDNYLVSQGRCIERKDPIVIFLSFIPIVALIFNVTTLVAVMLYRVKLKQNNIYIYVFSVLASNILFSILSTYQVFNHYYQFEGNPAQESSNAMRGWWVFRKALLVATYLIMVANIGALIYAIRAGRYVVAKATNILPSNENESPSASIQKQRRRAYILVSVTWCVPFTLALLTLTGWNCSQECDCLSGCYRLQNMESSSTRRCSRVISSLSNSYMGITAMVWFVEMGLLFFMICKTFSHSLLLTAGCMERKAVSNCENGNTPCGEAAQSNNNLEAISDRDKPESKSRIQKMSTRSRRCDRRRQRYAKWLRLTSRKLAYLTILFFLCTSPAMTCLMIDMFAQKMISSTTSSILLSLPIMYSIMCPVVLAKDLTGLKKALVSLGLICFPGTKTQQASATFPSSTASEKEKPRK